MKQIVDLQSNEEFKATGLELVSLATDPEDAWRDEASYPQIKTPLLSDEGGKVSKSYGVMKWAMGSEPGHTFVVVGRDGKVKWIRDYGAMEHGGLMYVSPEDLLSAMKDVRAKL